MEVVFYIGLVQALFAGILFISKKEKSASDKLLLGWFGTIALNMSFLLFGPTSIDFVRVLVIFNFNLFYGPLLFYYTRSLTTEKPLKLDFWLFIPFIIVNTCALFAQRQGFIKEPINFFYANDPNLVIKILWALSFLSSVVAYAIANIIQLKKYAKVFNDNFSSDTSFNNLNWLRLVNLLFVGGFLPLFIVGLFNISTDHKAAIPPMVFPVIGKIMLTYAFSFFVFNQPSLFHPSLLEKETKEKKSGFGDEFVNQITKKLFNFLKEEKPYLHDELTLQELADHIDIPKHQLTQILNRDIKKSFYALINEYRVQEAKERLKELKFSHLTVLAIGYDSGFKSKSTYNTMFKQLVGVTPSAYKKQKLKEA